MPNFHKFLRKLDVKDSEIHSKAKAMNHKQELGPKPLTSNPLKLDEE